jgi:hypothetical protein
MLLSRLFRQPAEDVAWWQSPLPPYSWLC